jgi:YidC/Oxa1 family membrane protein insertase
MEKRVLLAVVLSFVVLYGYQALFPPPKPADKPVTGTPAPQDLPAPAATGTPAATPPTANGPTAPVAEPTTGAPLVADSAERDITFENASVHAVFTTRGGTLKSWRLKKYQDAAREPLELVPHPVPPGSPRPFTLSVSDAATNATLAQALFKPTANDLVVTSGSATLAFDYEDASGLKARKEFLFTADSPYIVDFSATVSQSGKELVPTIQWGPGIGSGLVASTRTYSPPPQPIFYRDGSVSRIKAAKVPENAVQDGIVGFAGVDDHYFLAATLPRGRPLHVEYRALEVPLPSPPGAVAQFIDWSVR